ncbi:TlpA family protein disulfide reductase [Flavobacterium sp. '19STA2R22 D10 B1']|uniref:TlpA family protein disulfide reductase n=1 Tax=Flavobacterium aerium TaxID=3037261 RepID=UPI00278BFAA7|nr:TlpA disulfide reductase family protein [Flavobacterium sp. '19STA2R22 D10 B1']
MKKIFGLLSVIVLVSCNKAPEFAIVSGKVSNAATDGKVTITGGNFLKEITLKPDGTFSDTLLITYDGAYTVSAESGNVPLYLEKGTELGVTADYKDFSKSIAFTGKGAVENNYMKEKSEATQKEMGTTPEFYSLAEKEFVAKVDKIKKDQLALGEKTKFESKTFKQNELKNIDYAAQLSYINYPQYHAHFAQNPDFKPSATFPKEDEKMNLDNEADYDFSNSYKQIVSSNFYKKVEKEMKSENDKFSPIALPLLKTIKSQNIKNALAKELSYEIAPSNDNAEALYKDLMAISTNDKFKEDITTKFNKIKNLVKGKPSPTFEYENFKGGKTSLESLKGKYVYIDVWATWCGPCKQEIPSLLKVEEQYHGKNIEFVSISIDRVKDHETWTKMVTDMKLGGIQLFADKDWKSQFVSDYAIDGIPRFILLDPQGNIVMADAPRPSDPKLIETFNDLKI